MIDLYRMYDRQRSLLYVGISTNAATRAMQHASDKPWWPEVDYIHVEHLTCDRQTALTIERRTIREEKPRYNVVHNIPDEYEPTVQVRPFTTPKELHHSPTYRRLAYSIADFTRTAERHFGLDRDAQSLLIAHLQRAAPTPALQCDQCGHQPYAIGVQIITDKDNVQHAEIHAACPTCTTYLRFPAPRKD